MKDIFTHFGFGAGLAGLAMLAGEPFAAIFGPLILGYERERTQLCTRDLTRHSSHWKAWEWDAHQLVEAGAWPVGAVLAVALWRLL